MFIKLWHQINTLSNRSISTKLRLFRIILETGAGVIGFLLWLAVRSIAFSTVDWMICFIGYPIIIAWFFSILYFCRNGFDEKKH